MSLPTHVHFPTLPPTPISALVLPSSLPPTLYIPHGYFPKHPPSYPTPKTFGLVLPLPQCPFLRQVDLFRRGLLFPYSVYPSLYHVEQDNTMNIPVCMLFSCFGLFQTLIHSLHTLHYTWFLCIPVLFLVCIWFWFWFLCGLCSTFCTCHQHLQLTCAVWHSVDHTFRAFSCVTFCHCYRPIAFCGGLGLVSLLSPTYSQLILLTCMCFCIISSTLCVLPSCM